MIDVFPPAFFFFIAAAIIPFLPHGIFRTLVLLFAPLIAGLYIFDLSHGVSSQIELAGLSLELMRVDKLSVVFGLIFCLASFLGNLYALHVRDSVQQIAALAYVGSAVGAVFAGDLVTLFLYWEGAAITSVFLIWARRTQGAYHSGMRYLIMQIASGVILLGGTVLLYRETGSIAFEAMTLGSFPTWLIFIAFGIKCAFPLLHNWVQDAYPAATVTGTVILSSFTTKLAVYALARGFPGTEILIYIGATMTLFPIFYAVIENDLRRVLAYSLNNQLGFMVVGVGVGTELALNGTAAHAVSHILYKSLLFMSVGAVLFRTGTAKATQLGGLYKSMPLTMIFCVIGCASISAFPFFSGFVTKSLILSGAAKEGYYVVWGILLFASACAFHYSGIKIPYFAFFSHDSGLRPKEAPTHMLWAMGITAALCIGVGVFPSVLYSLLPYEISYNAYSITHVITQLQLLFFSALAFTVLLRAGIYPPMLKAVNLDFDWTYRKLLPAIFGSSASYVTRFWSAITLFGMAKIDRVISGLYRSHGPEGRMARVWPTGAMVLWIAIILTATMIVNFI
jgi:multicomponent Na+:H+ antiporter subunit D